MGNYERHSGSGYAVTQRYGAGDLKAGKIVFGLLMSAKALGLPYKHIADTFFGGNESPTEDELKAAGGKLKRTFLKKTPALKRLIEAVKESAKRGYLIGLDKRKLHIRSSHAALNTLLQSAGAIICKYWLLRISARLEEMGFKHGWDGDFAFMGWIHDEACVALRGGAVEAFKEVSRLAMKDAEEFFGFRCPLDVDVKLGQTWYDVH